MRLIGLPPFHRLPALAGRHDDEDVICLMRLPVNTPHPVMKAGSGVSKNHRILLANPEMSFYCTIKRSLVDSTKINNKIRMAGVYVRSDVCRGACFLAICYKNYFCSIK
jgi:hypothetical protein